MKWCWMCIKEPCYKESFYNSLVSFDADAWHLMLKPEQFDVETIEPSGITGVIYYG